MADDTKNTKDTDNKPTEFVKQYEDNEDDGYYFYPSRNNDKKEKSSYWKDAAFSFKNEQSTRCRGLILKCLKKSEKVQFMLTAMRVHGCPVDVYKHFSCEPCKMKISGGFDFNRNQVVICQNNIRSFNACCNVLSHELLHAFDGCRAKFDVTNVEHVACTEIRAANLFHCSFTNAMATGEASPINITARHQNCVKMKALASVMLVKSITREEGKEVVERVFDRCYNDLEPFGRRIKNKSNDVGRAVAESVLYGYK